MDMDARDQMMADIQVSTEEAIAFHVFETYRDKGINEEDAAEIGRTALRLAVMGLDRVGFHHLSIFLESPLAQATREERAK